MAHKTAMLERHVDIARLFAGYTWNPPLAAGRELIPSGGQMRSERPDTVVGSGL